MKKKNMSTVFAVVDRYGNWFRTRIMNSKGKFSYAGKDLPYVKPSCFDHSCQKELNIRRQKAYDKNYDFVQVKLFKFEE